MEKRCIQVRPGSISVIERLPKVNWSRGRLRPYESALSFNANFCGLNAISSSDLKKYIGIERGKFHSTFEYYKHIADMINECENSIENTYKGSYLSGYFEYKPYEANSFIQYCPRCVQYGYHSYLHDLVWLNLCPFHLIHLKKSSIRSSDQLEKFYKKENSGWPWAEMDCSLRGAGNNGYAALLEAWVYKASAKVKDFSDSRLWENKEYEDLHNAPVKNILGRLTSLEPLPKLLHPLIKSHIHWVLSTKLVPLKVTNEVIKIFSGKKFNSIFLIYKIINSHSPIPSGFSKKKIIYKEEINKLHKDGCQYEKQMIGSYFLWEKKNFFQNPCRQCPNLDAQRHIELEWGRGEDLMSSRALNNHLFRFIDLIKDNESSGLFCLKNGSRHSIELNALFNYEWKNYLLAKFFDAIAESELDLFFEQTTSWLKRINEGMSPSISLGLQGNIRVVFEGSNLKIITWKMVV